jgi:hypothetical protein
MEGKPWVGTFASSPQQVPAEQQQQPPDPTTILSQLEQAALQPHTAAFESGQATIKGLIQQRLDAEHRQYDIEMTYAKDAEAREKINRKYALSADRIRADAEPDLQTLRMKHDDTVAQVKARTAAKRIEIQTYQRLAEQNALDPEESLRQQYAAVGVEYNPQRVARNPIRDIDARLQEIAPLIKNVRVLKGKVQEAVDNEWVTVKDPIREAEIRDLLHINNELLDQKTQAILSSGRKPGVADIGERQMAPGSKTGWAGVAAYIKTATLSKPAGGGGYGLFPKKATAEPPTIRNDDDYNKLPSGSEYIDDKGNKRRKP